MATTLGTLPEAEHSAQLRKAVIASTVGTAIEWYDFFLYGTAAGLVFGKLYFPNEAPLAGTLAAFGTYFIGFVGRPIGAAIFGHYGDRIGRRRRSSPRLCAWAWRPSPSLSYRPTPRLASGARFC
jgi:MFS family permease